MNSVVELVDVPLDNDDYRSVGAQILKWPSNLNEN